MAGQKRLAHESRPFAVNPPTEAIPVVEGSSFISVNAVRVRSILVTSRESAENPSAVTYGAFRTPREVELAQAVGGVVLRVLGGNEAGKGRDGEKKLHGGNFGRMLSDGVQMRGLNG